MSARRAIVGPVTPAGARSATTPVLATPVWVTISSSANRRAIS